jgi:HK97 family phage major capsid protein
MDKETKDALDALKTAFESEWKAAVEAETSERVALGEATGETKAKVEKIADKLDELEATIEAAAKGRTDASVSGESPEAVERKAAFLEFVKFGVDGETKGMIVRDDTEGGFMAPVEFVATMVKGIVEMSPMRELAEVITTSRRAIQRPKRTGVASATWVGETGTRTETTSPTMGLDEIPTHELYARVLISQADIEDTTFDLEGWVRGEMAEQFGVAEAVALVGGDGNGKPHGLMENSDVEAVDMGDASLITADGLIDVAYALKDGYARNASWLMKRTTIRDIRKLKDAGDQNYLWQPGIAGNIPATILDRPYREAVDMPAIASDALAVAFGDFRRAYTIVDRLAMAVLHDPYTQAENGQIVLHARKRVGGQVRLPEAVKFGKIAA